MEAARWFGDLIVGLTHVPGRAEVTPKLIRKIREHILSMLRQFFHHGLISVGGYHFRF